MDTDAQERHAAFVARLRDGTRVPDAIHDALARVPRHHFLPGQPLDQVYADDAVVTHDEGGVPTSSSSQPSLMARMLDQLDVRSGDRVLEVGAGTGYNAALLAELGAAVTSVELQPEVAEAARGHLEAAGIAVVRAGDAEAPDVAPGTVWVVTGDGAAPPGGPYDRVIVTASLWSVPAALASAVAAGGVLVAPLRLNGIELALALRRDGDVLRGSGGLLCGFMPLRGRGDDGRGSDERPWRWPLGGGGVASADVDLGVEGRGALDRLLATPSRAVEDPFRLEPGMHALDALLWLGLQGDPLLSIARPPGGRGERPAWIVALDVLPASLLVVHLGPTFGRVARAELHGSDAALRAATAAMDAWHAAGAPGPAALELTVAPSRDRTGSSLPWRGADGATTLVRGTHRWSLRYLPAG